MVFCIFSVSKPAAAYTTYSSSVAVATTNECILNLPEGRAACCCPHMRPTTRTYYEPFSHPTTTLRSHTKCLLWQQTPHGRATGAVTPRHPRDACSSGRGGSLWRFTSRTQLPDNRCTIQHEPHDPPRTSYLVCPQHPAKWNPLCILLSLLATKHRYVPGSYHWKPVGFFLTLGLISSRNAA